MNVKVRVTLKGQIGSELTFAGRRLLWRPTPMSAVFIGRGVVPLEGDFVLPFGQAAVGPVDGVVMRIHDFPAELVNELAGQPWAAAVEVEGEEDDAFFFGLDDARRWIQQLPDEDRQLLANEVNKEGENGC
jgi:hypothetical protein